MAGLLDPYGEEPPRNIFGDTTGTSPLRNPLLRPMPNMPPQNYQQFIPPPAAVPGGRPMPIMPTTPPGNNQQFLPPPTEPGGRPMPVMPGVRPQSNRPVITDDPRATLLALFKAYGLT